MAIVDRLEDTLNGKYGGLYGEVVTEDCYKLRQLAFTPEIVFDLGANVGVFSRFARMLWPHAKIVAIEPDMENCEHFQKFTDQQNIVLLSRPVGQGKVWHSKGASNGAMECYLCEGVGYPMKLMREGVPDYEYWPIEAMRVVDIVARGWQSGMKAVFKMDIEGGENAVFDDDAAMIIIRQMDYIAIELHFHALTGAQIEEVRQVTWRALDSLKTTHECIYEHPLFFALKK